MKLWCFLEIITHISSSLCVLGDIYSIVTVHPGKVEDKIAEAEKLHNLRSISLNIKKCLQDVVFDAIDLVFNIHAALFEE